MADVQKVKDIAKVIAVMCEASSSSTLSHYLLNMGPLQKRKSSSMFEDVIHFKRFANPLRKKQFEKQHEHNIKSLYYSDDFVCHFKMRRPTVEFLIQETGKSLQRPTAIGRPRCDVQTAILHTIWTLSNQESFREICDRFDIGIGNGHRMFLNVCQILVEKRNLFIRWPTGSEMDDVAQKFLTLNTPPFPNVVGCIDATYIKIKRRKANAEAYNTSKNFQAIILQGVCDAQSKFMHIFAGWPGASEAACVWKSNDLYKKLTINPRPVIPKDHHLVGSTAYPLDTFLMVPYTENSQLTDSQRKYNTSIRSALAVSEKAFAMLKSRFQRLQYLDMNKLDQIPVVVVAACILHNVCLNHNDTLETVEPDDCRVEFDCSHDLPASGVAKRNHICSTFFC